MVRETIRALARQATGACLLGAVSVANMSAQESWRVTVRDTSGLVIPYALLDVVPGGRRVADVQGSAQFPRPAADSVLLQVRRIGFAEFSARVSSRADVEVRLVPLARTLETMNIAARQNTLLAQQGFYERMERVQRGAVVGEFITPEELEAMGAMTVSRAFSRSRHVRVVRGRGNGVSDTKLLGRSDCGFTVLVDGQRVESLQDHQQGLTSIDPRGTSRAGGGREARPPSIEELVPGSDIAAIEVYPSAANAPSELQARAMGGRGSCGIIAIWTGGRR